MKVKIWNGVDGMEKILNVEGMSCGHCEKSVKDSVGSLTGVTNVEVNLDSGEVKVDYDAAVVTFEAITETIERQGFDVID